MSFFDFGKSIPETVKAVGDLYTTDKARIEAEANFTQAQAQLQAEIQKGVVAQANVNAILAAANDFYKSGWIPLIGWTAGFLILLFYAPQIVITTYVWGGKCMHTGIVTKYPMQADQIIHLVYLLFGFGGYSLVKPLVTPQR